VRQYQLFPRLGRLQLLDALLYLKRKLVARADARRIPPPRGQLGSTSWSHCSLIAWPGLTRCHIRRSSL